MSNYVETARQTKPTKSSDGADVARTDFLSRNGWKLLALLPPAWLIFIVARYGVNVPMNDQWEFVPFLDKTFRGELTLGDIWAQHNEHRIFFPKLIMLGLARLTHWDIRWEFTVTIVCAIGIFAVVAWQIRSTAALLAKAKLKWAIPAASLIIFSISQVENWLWGWQLQMLLEVLAVWGAVALLARPAFHWKAFVGAAALGIVAIYSFGNGVLVWPIGLALLFAIKLERTKRVIAAAAWLLVGALSVGLYLHGYHKPLEHRTAMMSFQRPGEAIMYIFKYLGNMCSQYGNGGILPDRIYAVIFGVAALSILGWAVWCVVRRPGPDWRALLPYLAMAGYSCASAALTAVGRAGLGSNEAGISRYSTMTAPLWIAIVVLLLLISENKPPTDYRTVIAQASQQNVARWLLWATITFVGLSSTLSVRQAQECFLNRARGRRVLLDTAKHPDPSANHDYLWVLYPIPQTVMERYPVLVKHRLSLFKNEAGLVGTPNPQ